MVSKALTTAFDYATVDKDTKGKLIVLAGQVKRGKGGQIKSIIEIGCAIHEAHELLAGDGRDGKFREWVELECGFEKSTAYNYLHSFEEFAKCEVIEQFSPTAMYALAAPNTPDNARKEAIKRATKGERIIKSVADDIIESFTVADKPKQTSVQRLDTSAKPQASATGTPATSTASSPDLPSVGTVNRTESGSQDSGDAGECPPGKHVWTDDGDGEYCKACKVSREDVEVWPVVGGKPSGGITFDPSEFTPSEVKDGHGDEVTGDLRHVFEICEEFKEKRQMLTNLKTWVTQRIAHPGCAVLATAESRIKTDIDTVDRELKFATPFCVCVYCNNKMPKVANCTACKGRGWMTQDVYKAAPKEMKRA